MAQIIRAHFGDPGPHDAPPETTSVACLNLSPAPGMVEENLLLAEREVRSTLRRRPDVRWPVLP
jgi:5-aminopentanamidase